MSFMQYPILLTSSLCVFGSYALASTFFYYFPQMLHCKKGKSRHSGAVRKTKNLVISHRGGAGENVENTITAFDHSQNIGVDVLEMDVHLTKDGHVVVAHDNDLTRCTGIDCEISKTNYDELPSLLRNTYITPFKSSKEELSCEYISNNDTPESRKFPLLEEVFHRYPNLPINLDLKVNNDELIEKVNMLVKKYKREHLIVWGSFNEQVTRKLHKLNPSVDLMFSLKGVISLLVLHLTGLLPFVPLKETYFEIICPNMILNVFIRKSFVNHLQKRGILVYFWVLNTDEEFEVAVNAGVNGVITDYPTKLINYLECYSKAK